MANSCHFDSRPPWTAQAVRLKRFPHVQACHISCHQPISTRLAAMEIHMRQLIAVVLFCMLLGQGPNAFSHRPVRALRLNSPTVVTYPSHSTVNGASKQPIICIFDSLLPPPRALLWICIHCCPLFFFKTSCTPTCLFLIVLISVFVPLAHHLFFIWVVLMLHIAYLLFYQIIPTLLLSFTYFCLLSYVSLIP